jgi:hypothetical protein
MEVGDKFVFYMPADMKPAEFPGDTFCPTANYANGQLMWNYSYSPDLCGPIPDWLLKDPTYRESDVYIGGQSAKAQRSTSRTSGNHFITVCLSDIDGYGTHLHLGAVSKDERAIDVARQIFASIQFRKGAT